ncbi:MAG: hypothetical protein JXB60_01515 [Candidatus Cloacimonetes bacterium]|nr:hypothetical protein [Candidatus Cloacimonadota bacterium]
MSYETNFLLALIISLAIEIPLLVILYRIIIPATRRSSSGSVIFTGFVATTTTLPYLWFILPCFIRTRFPYLVLSEILAILVEALLIEGIIRPGIFRSLLLAGLCNLASLILGAIFFDNISLLSSG